MRTKLASKSGPEMSDDLRHPGASERDQGWKPFAVLLLERHGVALGAKRAAINRRHAVLLHGHNRACLGGIEAHRRKYKQAFTGEPRKDACTRSVGLRRGRR